VSVTVAGVVLAEVALAGVALAGGVLVGGVLVGAVGVAGAARVVEEEEVALDAGVVARATPPGRVTRDTVKPAAVSRRSVVERPHPRRYVDDLPWPAIPAW